MPKCTANRSTGAGPIPAAREGIARVKGEREMARGIIRLLDIAGENVRHEIRAYAARGRLAAAMASEGYNGGYRDALVDVALALRGFTPQRNGWWEKREEIADT